MFRRFTNEASGVVEGPLIIRVREDLGANSAAAVGARVVGAFMTFDATWWWETGKRLMSQTGSAP